MLVESFLDLAKANSWTVYENGELNVVGVRYRNSRVNYFDDLICVYRKTSDKQGWTERYYPATTRPGTPYLLKPVNKHGSAILVPGQYRSYAIGLHRGKYEALIQVDLVKVYRDSDQDTVYDEDTRTIEEGYFGINIHKASLLNRVVGTSSAGCQVFQRSEDFAEFMCLCKCHASQFGNVFTYTLVEL